MASAVFGRLRPLADFLCDEFVAGPLPDPGDAIKPYGGGDFNPRKQAYYWTLEQATAEKYFQYARDRCQYSEIWMITVQVRKSFVDSLKSSELCYSHDSKASIRFATPTAEPKITFAEYST